MKDLSLKVKLGILTVVVAVGFLIVGVVVNSELTSLKVAYEKSKSTNSSMSALKSILMVGVIYYSLSIFIKTIYVLYIHHYY